MNYTQRSNGVGCSSVAACRRLHGLGRTGSCGATWVQAPEERGAVRWTAGAALLRLARSHHSALSTEDYHALSLVMSDPVVEVGPPGALWLLWRFRTAIILRL